MRNKGQLNAVTYGRQSQAGTAGSLASPLMQKQQTAKFCEKHGYNLIAHFEDVDRSAWDLSVDRPGFRSLMDFVRAGRADVVVVYEVARLTRRGARDALLLETELTAYGVRILSVSEPGLNRGGRNSVMFVTLADRAQQESEEKSTYIKASREMARAAGGHLAGRAPYGFTTRRTTTADGVSVLFLKAVEEEAGHIRYMARRILDGLTLSGVAQELTDMGVPTPGVSRTPVATAAAQRRTTALVAPPHWTQNTIRRILGDPRTAGMAADLVRGGDRVAVIRRDASGQPLRVHDAMISEDVWYEVQKKLAVLGAPRGPRRPAPRGLLGGTGFLRCGCGAGMRVKEARTGDLYQCGRSAAAARAAGHSRVSITCELADEVLPEMVFERLRGLDSSWSDDAALLEAAETVYLGEQGDLELQAGRKAAEGACHDLEKALRAVYRDRDAGLYTGRVGDEAFRERVGVLTQTLTSVESRLAELTEELSRDVALPIAEWLEEGPESRWSVATVEERKQFLSLFVDHVVVSPGQRGRYERVNRDTRGRLRIHWRST